MGLIIKGDKKINVVSKKEMNEILEDAKEAAEAEAKAFARLPASKRERREAIQDVKRHREFMERVHGHEKESMIKDAIITSEVVSEANQESVVQQEAITEDNLPKFESMTKKEIDEWAEENIGLALDRRKTKSNMIEELKKHL